MAVGDEAVTAGYQLVPNTGPEGLVKLGAQEINRTRDYVAEVKSQIPVGKSNFRAAAGISSGTAAPSGGSDGDIYFQIIG